MLPEIGTELVNPATGTRTVFRATAASTDGAYVEVEATYPPHGSPPLRHLHPQQDEHFTVLRGHLRCIRDGEQLDLRAGEEFDVPRGAVHQMWSPGDEATVVLWRTSPALRTGEMFCDLWQTHHDTAWNPPPRRLAAVAARYSAEFRLAETPRQEGRASVTRPAPDERSRT